MAKKKVSVNTQNTRIHKRLATGQTAKNLGGKKRMIKSIQPKNK